MAGQATAADVSAPQNPDSAIAHVVDPAEVPTLNAANLIDAGVHYGHSTRYWNPKMKRWIFGKKGGVHIINLKETIRGAVRARFFLKQIASAGLDVMIVGTKKQAAEVVRVEAARCSMPFVASRWLGGTLTNYNTVRGRLARLEQIESMKASGEFAASGKKLQSMIEREYKKVAFNFEGLRHLDKLPSALLVIDTGHEHNAVKEARKLNIPIVGIVDTNSDPEGVDIVIPANDDSLRGIQIILHYVVGGILEGKKLSDEGRGLQDRSGLIISSNADIGGRNDKRRDGKDRGRGRGDNKDGRRGGGGGGGGRTRTSNKEDNRIEESSQESVEAAEAQNRPGSAQVRVKPTRASTEAPAAAAAPAPAAAPAAEKPADASSES